MWKKLRQRLSQILKTPATGSRRHQRRPRRILPAIEMLEDRAVPATFAVTTFADVVNPNDGVLSLREAISRANATTAPDTIQLQAGVYRIGLSGADDANALGDFDVTNPLTIVGRGAGATAIESNDADINRERLF